MERWRDLIERAFCSHTAVERESDFFLKCGCGILIYSVSPNAPAPKYPKEYAWWDGPGFGVGGK